MARVIFAGSPEFAVPSLERLIASQHEVIAVLTQPDRPAGRGRRVQPGPVKSCAQRHGLTVCEPVTLRAAEAQAQLAGFAPELMVVAAYGLLLPPAVLALPKAGCINVHASLLPRWRGASPIQAAILAGDLQTGVSIMQMAKGLDTGPVYALEPTAVGAAETAAQLQERLAVIGAELLMRCLDGILSGALTPTPQADADATHAARIKKSEALIDWARPAVEIDRQIRAYNPWPVADTRLDNERMRCWLSSVPGERGSPADTPGRVVAATADGIDVKTGDGVLRIIELQLPGRRRLTAGEFVHGRDLVGKLLGQ